MGGRRSKRERDDEMRETTGEMEEERRGENDGAAEDRQFSRYAHACAVSFVVIHMCG